MTPIRNPEGLIEGFQHPEPRKPERTLVQMLIKDAGMGNALFEFAAGYGIAKRLGMHFRWSWKPSNLREFGLTPFGMAETSLPDTPVVAGKLGQGNLKLVEACERAILKSELETVGISCPFQCEECFLDMADEIRELFKLEPIDLPHPAGTTLVGVQVRRGDYVGHSRLNVTTPAYFKNAMEWIRGNVTRPHFIVVSDDPAYCTSIFKGIADVTVMPPQDAITGLRTLASCEAHIISNSTYGWWGAWLGEKGPVCVPEIWHHKPGSYGDWKPAPDRWKRIPIGLAGKPLSLEPVKMRVVMPAEAPTLERAIVYPWHADQQKWDELRYSLRSVHEHFDDKDCPIFIMGTRRPPWLTEARNSRVRYVGAYTYKQALEKGLQIAETVMWMNDDIWFLKRSSWAECAVPRYLRDVGPDFIAKAEQQTNPWRRVALDLLRKLHDMGITDQKVYSTHTPYVFEREKSLDVFSRFGITEKHPFELAYFHLHAKDPQLLDGMLTQELPLGDATWLNCADRHLTPEVKADLVRRFPKQAPWELEMKI